MRAVIQRVSRAEVRVEGRSVARIGRGLVILLGVLRGDDERRAARLAERVALFRVFPDQSERMNLSLLDVEGEALVVSQITLAADGRKGRRPSLDAAASPPVAEVLYRRFARALEDLGVRPASGVFGAKMEIELVNEGPVTFVLEEPAGALDTG